MTGGAGSRRGAATAMRTSLLLVVAVLASIGLFRGHRDLAVPSLRYTGVVVTSPLRLPGAIVRGASREWNVLRHGALAYGEPVAVGLTMYCLQGTTRRGRYVRAGIVAADPRLFPLSRYIELYIGRKYLGRFLVDDTGGKIKGPHLDIWTPDCRQARLFGWQHGTAALVTRPVGVKAGEAPPQSEPSPR